MNKKDLLNLSYPNDSEKKLKLLLNNQSENYSLGKAFMTLSRNNVFLLNQCEIDENNFNYILFKNYIYFLNSKKEIKFENFFSKNQDIMKTIINEFNNHIKNNDFEGALKIYENSYPIYELLCFIYIKNLNKNEIEKINQVPNNLTNNIYEKISLLQNTDLSFKRNNNKKLEKILN